MYPTLYVHLSCIVHTQERVSYAKTAVYIHIHLYCDTGSDLYCGVALAGPMQVSDLESHAGGLEAQLDSRAELATEMKALLDQRAARIRWHQRAHVCVCACVRASVL